MLPPKTPERRYVAPPAPRIAKIRPSTAGAGEQRKVRHAPNTTRGPVVRYRCRPCGVSCNSIAHSRFSSIDWCSTSEQRRLLPGRGKGARPTPKAPERRYVAPPAPRIAKIRPCTACAEKQSEVRQAPNATSGPVVRYRCRPCGVSSNSLAHSRFSSIDWCSTSEQRRLLPSRGKASLLPLNALERRYVAPPASRSAKIRPSTARTGEQRKVRQVPNATRGPVVRYRCRPCGVSCNSIAQSRLSSVDWRSTGEQRRLLPGRGKGSLLPRNALERRYVVPPAPGIAKIRPCTACAGKQSEVRQAPKVTRGPVVRYRCRTCGVSCNSIAQSRFSSIDWSSTGEQRRLLPGCGKGSLLPRNALERRYVGPQASRIAKIRPSTARAGEQRKVRQAPMATRGAVVRYRCRPCGVCCNSIAHSRLSSFDWS